MSAYTIPLVHCIAPLLQEVADAEMMRLVRVFYHSGNYLIRNNAQIVWTKMSDLSTFRGAIDANVPILLL